MNRRSLIRGLLAAPALPAAVATLANTATAGRVFASREGLPGYREWCMAMGDGQIVKVYLDGILQKRCFAVDEGAGTVSRLVTTAKGNIAHDGKRPLEEIVTGRVEIVIEDRG